MGLHNRDCVRGARGIPPENFEILNALKYGLGASEAPLIFSCVYTVHNYLSSISSFRLKSMTYGALASGLFISQVR